MTMATRYPVGMSTNLEEMWRCGCPTSPDWDSKMEMNSVKVGACVTDHRQAIESPLWVSVRAFLASEDVLHMRAERHLFSPEWPDFRYDQRHIYGVKLGILRFGQILRTELSLIDQERRFERGVGSRWSLVSSQDMANCPMTLRF